MKIFESFKEKKKELLIDFRERSSIVPKLLKEKGMNIEFKMLEFGDYIIDGIIIERKSSEDFINSMINGRLYSQLDKLKDLGKSILIIEDIKEAKKRINPNSIRGFLLSLSLNYETKILFSDSPEETAEYISLLGNRKAKERRVNFSKKPKDEKTQIKFILESFTGIGPKNSEKLLKEFKSLKNIFDAKPEELRKVLGTKADSLSIIRKEVF